MIELSPDDVHRLREAIDSWEYWENRDYLPHSSGYILDPDDDHPEDESQRELRAEIDRYRELDDRLAKLYPNL